MNGKSCLIPLLKCNSHTPFTYWVCTVQFVKTDLSENLGSLRYMSFSSDQLSDHLLGMHYLHGLFVYLIISLVGFEGRIKILIVSVPKNCLYMYFYLY